jgi:uncharacterized protein (DUF486 family)
MILTTLIQHPFTPLFLLLISNIFMTYAWYGHLKDLATKPFYIAILSSWFIAFFEYCFQVPANRLGAKYYSLSQLKIIQEVLTLIVFVCFSTFYFKMKFTWNYLYAGICLLGAVYFIFTEKIS